MFKTQRKQGGGFLLVGMGVVLAAWMATAGVMLKAYTDGKSSQEQCEVVCNGSPATSVGHG